MSAQDRLIAAAWMVIAGALLVAFTLTWGALLEMNRSYPPVIELQQVNR